MAEKNFKITGGLALGDYALTANGVSLLWDSNAIASQSYVDTAVAGATVNVDSLVGTGLFNDSGDIAVNTNTIATRSYVDSAVSGVTVNTNAIATSLSSSTLFVDSGDNLNVNTNVIATKEYVDSVAQGLDVKESVKYATTSELVGTYSSGNNTLTMTTAGGTSVDGQGVNPNDRVLIKDQSATGQNGIYTVTTAGADDGRGTVTTTVFTRAADALALDAGAFTFVETGTTNAGKGFVYNGDVSGTWSQFSEAGSLTAGSNIYLNAGAINVNVNSLVGDLDGSGLYVTGNQLAINTNVVASALASTTLFVDTGDNLNVNVAAIVGDLDGAGLYVDANQLAVNTNTIASRSYVDTAISGVTVNTNAVATSLASSTLYVSDGDNLNINVNALVGDLDGSGLYVSSNQLAVNVNALVTGLDNNGYLRAISNEVTLPGSGDFTITSSENIVLNSGAAKTAYLESATAGNEIAIKSYVDSAVSGVTVNTNAVATSLSSSTLYVSDGDNLNINVNALVGDLDGSGLYVSSNQLAVNVNAFVGDLDGSGLYVDGVTLAVNTNVIATKSYVDSVAQGLDVKASVKAATTGNMFFVGYGGASPATFDGITFDTGDRLLVKNQTTTSENGIYVYGGDASGTFTRAADADTTADFNKGAFTFVESGTVNAGKGFVVTAAGTLGTDAITWAQFSEAGSLTAGSNIYLESNSINVNVNSLVGDLDGSGLYVSSNQLAVNVNAIVGDFDGSGLYVSSNQLAVNTNALAGTGLVSSSGTLALDQYAAGVRYDGTSAVTNGKSVKTDTWYGFTAASNTYGTVGDTFEAGQAFTFDILMRDNDNNARKSTVSGFVDTSGNIEYTEYAIVDSATPLTAADVIVESVSAGTYNLRAKATFGGMNQISIVANAVILDY